MAYLIRKDYKSLIQADSLTQIIGSDSTLLTYAENAAQKKVVEYLTQKYDTDKEFTNTRQYVYGTIYKAKDRVYLDATAYSATTGYDLNSLVLQAGNVYICTIAIATPEAFNAGKWTLLGAQYAIFFVTLPNNEWDYYTEYSSGDQVWFEDKVYTSTNTNTGVEPTSSTATWGSGTAYALGTTVRPTDTTKWTSGDNRNENVVECMIDLILYQLHSRIAPVNIPDLRVKRYDDAMNWLKSCAKGDWITASIPRIQPRAGMRTRYGARYEKRNNNF